MAHTSDNQLTGYGNNIVPARTFCLALTQRQTSPGSSEPRYLFLLRQPHTAWLSEFRRLPAHAEGGFRPALRFRNAAAGANQRSGPVRCELEPAKCTM